MTSVARTPNHDEGLSAQDNITGRQKYLTGTSSAGKFSLDTTGGGGGGSYPSNVISTNNSSTTNLSGAAVFTGVSEDVSAYADIRVNVFSDVASATDGLSMQQSIDGTNWDFQDNYTIAAGVGKVFDVPVYARYFRVVYTNGAGAQTAFRLQSVFHISRTKPSSQRPMDARSNENDMEENLSYPMIYNVATNQWNRAKDTGVTGIPAHGVSDGTNTANVLKSDGTAAGQNAVMIAGSRQEFTGLTAGSLNADLLPSTDVSNYAGISVQIAGTWTGTITFQTSNDNTNFVSTTLIQSVFAGSGTQGPTTAANGLWYGSTANAKYFRVRMTAYTSGTATGVVELKAIHPPMQSINAGAANTTVGSNSATGAAVPANAFFIGMQDSGGLLKALTRADAAADANTNGVNVANSIYNGSTYDRMRSATAASNTTGTGLLGVGNLLFDGTNWQAMRGTKGDAASSSGYTGVVLSGKNGTTYDEMRFNTNGVIVAAGATTGQSVTTTTYNARLATITVNVSAYTSGTINLAINILTSSGYSYSPFASITGLTATGTVVYRIGPGLTAAAGLTANDMLGRSLQVITSGTFTATYGIDLNLGV